MWRYMVRGLLGGIPVILGVTFVIFLAIDLAPGNSAAIIAGQLATKKQIAAVEASLGLDKPLLVRYFDWLGSLLHGDLGSSLQTGQPVASLVLHALTVTLSLVLIAMAGAILFAVVLGVIAAVKPTGWFDRTVSAVAGVALSIPPFWFGLLLVLLFSLKLGWFPVIGYVSFADSPLEWFYHLILPAIALGSFAFADLVLQLKGAMSVVLTSDYILTAKAKGLSPKRVLVKHALKNAAVPVVTVFGYRFAALLGGAATVETVFNLQGIGRLAVDAAFSRDFPVLLGIVVVTSILVVLINLLVDLSYGYFNPKVRK